MTRSEIDPPADVSMPIATDGDGARISDRLQWEREQWEPDVDGGGA